MENKSQHTEKKSPAAILPKIGWWLAALYIIPLLVILFNKLAAPLEINQGQFESLLKARQVRDITILENRNRVEVSVRGNTARDAQTYSFRIISPEFFERDLQALQADIPDAQKAPYHLTYRSNLGGYVFTWAITGLLFLVAAAFWLQALTDAINRPFPHPIQRVLWITALFLFPVVGFLLYSLSVPERKAWQ